MVSIVLGCLIVGQGKVRDFGVIVKEADWRNTPMVECVAELEKTGKLKIKLDCAVTGTVTLLMRNVPAPEILKQALHQQNLLVEKRDGVLHIIKAPNESNRVKAPFEEATIVSGMKILGPWLGMKYRCETEYCNDKLVRLSTEPCLPMTHFLWLLKACGATYEIERGVYVIKDDYWYVPRKFGGGAQY
jgi:hypothetical protein